MEILIPLLIALIILGIAVILNRRKKSRKQSDMPETKTDGEDWVINVLSRKQSDTPETLTKSERSLSTPGRVKPQTPARTVQENKSVEDAEAAPETPSISEPKTPYHPPSHLKPLLRYLNLLTIRTLGKKSRCDIGNRKIGSAGVVNSRCINTNTTSTHTISMEPGTTI